MPSKPPSVAIYPGSFDPITNGHLDLIQRGSRLFDKLIVSILQNDSKEPLFSVEERAEMLREVVAVYPNVEIDSFHGLLVDHAAAHSATVLLRGIRAISDYEFELQMAFDESPAQSWHRNYFHDGQRSLFVYQFAAGERSLQPGRRYRRFGASSGRSPSPPAAFPHPEERDIAASMQSVANPIAERISSISVSSTMKVSADAEKLRASGVDVVDFGAGEPDFPTPDNIKQAAIRALEQNFTKYTAAGGTLELKKAVCERHAQDFGTSYQPSECLITVGGKHVIFNLMQAAINPGDEVVIPVPYWVTYKDVVNYAGGNCVFVDTGEASGFALTAAMVEPHLTARTKMVIVNSPSNPSGAVIDRGEFEKIFQMTSKRGIYLMTDECYGRFLYDSEPFSIASLPGAKETVLVAGSLSKTYAMTGWRIGFGLVPAALVGAMTKLQSHSTSNPTSISQKAAVEALRGPQESVGAMLAEYRRRRDFVVQRLRAIPGVTCPEPRGAFYVYPNVGVAIGGNGIANTMQFAEKLLAEAHVAVVPGEAFGTTRQVRISYATSLGELERGLDRLHKFVVRHS